MEMETIYIGECHHLFCDNIQSDRCLKRYFTIYDLRDFKYKRLALCNDYLRIKINEKKDFEKQYFINSIIENIILDYLNIGEFPFIANTSKKVSDEVTINICDRPFINTTVSLSYIFDNYQKLDSVTKMYVRRRLLIIFENINHYEKYKAHRAEFKRVINKMQYQNISIELIDLMIKFFNSKLK